MKEGGKRECVRLSVLDFTCELKPEVNCILDWVWIKDLCMDGSSI